jgi:hypothetical protein
LEGWASSPEGPAVEEAEEGAVGWQKLFWFSLRSCWYDSGRHLQWGKKEMQEK